MPYSVQVDSPFIWTALCLAVLHLFRRLKVANLCRSEIPFEDAEAAKLIWL